MTRARKTLISLCNTEYYHCISRCVRRAFLCGEDIVSGVCYEHRRQWLENRLLDLVQYFDIDIAAYAVMSNHYHVVLHVDLAKAQGWSNIKVVRQWHGVFAGTELSKQFLSGATAYSGAAEPIRRAMALLVPAFSLPLQKLGWLLSTGKTGMQSIGNTHQEFFDQILNLKLSIGVIDETIREAGRAMAPLEEKLASQIEVRIQRMIACDTRFQHLSTWEGVNPAPRMGSIGLGKDQRYQEVKKLS